ncbi:tRNA-specific adenosine deaminase [Buchnera aphidicola (Nipponaphis monzeni)]|uniref:tRNA-specific adenosine deaminase n=1 Tax=Buchnera aphidicola (Nipponaphis monzeni) TaxID=2495405 RepID=A0A455TA55_9GAMM|nr:tRNA adenosine(34) deaminase TadA [Buchnera aphidicola]BBI01212.1 tRNA-specific adenosine deaminase [Buchnera aphidicola (Nipponaphis monzeni)]
MNKKKDIYWIKNALYLAKHAESKGEVPVGAVLVLNDKKISEGWNCSILSKDPTAHAEIIALRKGAQILNNYRLVNTTLYVTLEPCLMCLGAILNSRIKKLVYGACDNTNNKKNFWKILLRKNVIEVTNNILHNKCSYLIKNFFKKKDY